MCIGPAVERGLLIPGGPSQPHRLDRVKESFVKATGFILNSKKATAANYEDKIQKDELGHFINYQQDGILQQ